jgi:heme/copper-type cytochrome/quinol oxidase subunit 3
MKQYAAAKINADEAMRWSYIGVALGFIFWIIYIFAFSPLMRFIKTSL